MGGLDPLYEPSPRLYSPQGGNPLGIRSGRLLLLPQEGKPLGGWFPSNPPQMAPPNLGIARIRWGVFLEESLPIFTDLYGLSWEIILSHK